MISLCLFLSLTSALLQGSRRGLLDIIYFYFIEDQRNEVPSPSLVLKSSRAEWLIFCLFSKPKQNPETNKQKAFTILLFSCWIRMCSVNLTKPEARLPKCYSDGRASL